MHYTNSNYNPFNNTWSAPQITDERHTVGAFNPDIGGAYHGVRLQYSPQRNSTPAIEIQTCDALTGPLVVIDTLTEVFGTTAPGPNQFRVDYGDSVIGSATGQVWINVADGLFVSCDYRSLGSSDSAENMTSGVDTAVDAAVSGLQAQIDANTAAIAAITGLHGSIGGISGYSIGSTTWTDATGWTFTITKDGLYRVYAGGIIQNTPTGASSTLGSYIRLAVNGTPETETERSALERFPIMASISQTHIFHVEKPINLLIDDVVTLQAKRAVASQPASIVGGNNILGFMELNT